MAVISELSYALGSGTGAAMVWFPITYYAMRKQFKLKPLFKLWRPFWGCVVLFAILHLFFGESAVDTPASVMMFMGMPIVVSASILFWTNREQPSKLLNPDGRQDKKAVAAKEPSLAPFTAQDTVRPTNAGSSKEVIAFRFLLMAWVIGLLALFFSGSSYLMAEWEQGKVSSTYLAAQPCVDKVMQTTSDCNASVSNGTCSNLAMRCYGERFNRLLTEREEWNERAENLLYVAPWLLILPSLLFYGIRWAITGRLKPLWLLRR